MASKRDAWKKPNDGQLLLSVANIAYLFGLSPSMIYQLLKSKRFPKPILLNDTCKMWRRDIVEMWIRLECPHSKNIDNIIKAAQRREANKRTKNLHDCYIKALLTSKGGLGCKDIPAELIDAKREHLKLKRVLSRRT